ncbi:MAG: hypothetical protein ACRDOO_21660 [Actinomadura sp.]
MTGQYRQPDTNAGTNPPDVTRARPDRESPPRMPRWVKIPMIVIGALLVLFVALQLAGLGGEHGPGRHIPGQNQEQNRDPSMPGH